MCINQSFLLSYIECKIIMDSKESQLGLSTISIIKENLYLGGLAAAKDLEVLKKYNITHILTIDICPLPPHITELKNLVTKFVQIPDQPKEDLLSHFDETDIFIKEGMEKGTVLVHCYFGVSRSASVIIAHIMKKDQLSYFEAFDLVKKKRKIISPNPGFVLQLKLYKDMGYKIDNSNMDYKNVKLAAAAHQIKKVKILPEKFYSLIKPEPILQQSKPQSKIFRCKKCRRILAAEDNLLVHKANNANCTKTYFIEPIVWMNVSQENEGQLLCPKCSSKLGSFNWITGCPCPCGVQITPAFQLIPSKVDLCC